MTGKPRQNTNSDHPIFSGYGVTENTSAKRKRVHSAPWFEGNDFASAAGSIVRHKDRPEPCSTNYFAVSLGWENALSSSSSNRFTLKGFHKTSVVSPRWRAFTSE